MEQKTLKAYEYFLRSQQNFTNDVANENIEITQTENRLDFTLYQGTAIIKGYVTKEHFCAETILIKAEHANVSLKRHLLERNYNLTYCSYFSDKEYIKLKLYLDNITMTPQKIFYPLRELALNGDFDKEYIRTEFKQIPLEDTSHTKMLETSELEIKYNFLHKWIGEYELSIASFPSTDNAGMQAFATLGLLFKLDYLLVPKYDMFHHLNRKIQEYFIEDSSTIESKNEELKEYISEIKEFDFETFSQKFFNAKYTFNPLDRTSQEEMNLFISESLLKVRWYKNNRHTLIIPTIHQYIALYMLYNYGLHPVIKSLLHMLISIYNPQFLEALGYPVLYKNEENNFAKRAIISQIEDIIKPYQKRFKSLKPFGSELNFTSLNEFSNSFYLRLKNLNFEEI
ncbi:MAG: hypothetical protein RBR59_02865 [Sulfurimonadaceae bacterium]|jgi:hypothetical protein|nr:hypothetical protein [Sulfurimonadaceae bacterium]